MYPNSATRIHTLQACIIYLLKSTTSSVLNYYHNSWANIARFIIHASLLDDYIC
uniref:Uncharacterized protein n=1 Tax=Moniliophthora roreri TaxID=221103 RepID=A0A0W0FSS6_MONRR